jgi:RNA polymerase sigma factor (sigma-70 family)
MREEFSAIDNLFSDEHDKLVQHAARFGALDPEDAVQEAYRSLIRVGSQDVPLLYKLVERRSIDSYRKLVTRREHEEPRGLLQSEEELARIEPWSVDRAEFTDSFNHAVAQLDTGEREAFVLTELRGLSQYEAADLLGVHQTTVLRRANRARLQIREEIA